MNAQRRRSRRRAASWIACAVVLAAACAARPAGAAHVFASPLKNFSVTVPSLGPNTKVEKTFGPHGGEVRFLAGTGEYREVACHALVVSPPDSASLDTLLQGALDYAMQGSKASVLERDRFRLGGTYARFVAARFADDAAGESARNTLDRDAVRGLVAFVKGRWLYVLTSDPLGMAARTLPPGDRPKNARRQLVELYRAITFR